MRFWEFFDRLGQAEIDHRKAFRSAGLPYKGGFATGFFVIALVGAVWVVMRCIAAVLPKSGVARWLDLHTGMVCLLAVALFFALWLIRLWSKDGWVGDRDEDML